MIDAGRYDGNLGVVAGILAVEEIRARGIALPFDLEVLAFGDEEGVRFPKTLFGSSTIAGVLEPAMLDLVDADGRQDRRCAPRRSAAIRRAAPPRPIGRDDVVGYLEVHIEQGPVLEAAGEPLGVVSAIASQGRYRLQRQGRGRPCRHRADGISATTRSPPRRRSSRWSKRSPGVAPQTSVVGTVGELRVHPGASNVIPGDVALQPRCARRQRCGAGAAAGEIGRASS